MPQQFNLPKLDGLSPYTTCLKYKIDGLVRAFAALVGHR